MRSALAAVAVAALVAAGAGAARGDDMLPEAPLSLEVTPLAVGVEASIRLTPLGPPAPADVFLVRIPSGVPFLDFLTPTGTWSRTPVAYRRAAAGATAPLVARWDETGPPGFVSLVAVFTRPGGDPLARQEWAYQPRMVRARVDAAPGPRAEALRVLGLLGVATAVGLALVIVVPRVGRASA